MELSPWGEVHKPHNELSREEIITKFQTLPPLKRQVIDIGFAHTTPLIELFQICIDKFDDIERRGEIYGKISVVDSEGSHTLYHRDRDNTEHIRANSTLSLTGPSRSFLVLNGIAVSIKLFLRCDKDGSNASEDFVLSNWQFSWDALKPEVAHITRGKFLQDFLNQPELLPSELNCKHQPVGYDQPLAATFEGPNGCCLTMYYAMLEHASQAWIKVEVIDINGVPNVIEYNARGSIFAKYGRFEHENDSSIVDYCKIELLKTGDLNPVKVERWKEIQLSRWIVAVPTYSSLVIEADLWDAGSRLKFGEGKVEFIPGQTGSSAVDYIRGDVDFALRVMVCWCFGSKVSDKFPY